MAWTGIILSCKEIQIVGQFLICTNADVPCWGFPCPKLYLFKKRVRKDRKAIKDHKERMDHKDKRANRDQGECREHVMPRHSSQDIWAFFDKGRKRISG